MIQDLMQKREVWEWRRYTDAMKVRLGVTLRADGHKAWGWGGGGEGGLQRLYFEKKTWHCNTEILMSVNSLTGRHKFNKKWRQWKNSLVLSSRQCVRVYRKRKGLKREATFRTSWNLFKWCKHDSTANSQMWTKPRQPPQVLHFDPMGRHQELFWSATKDPDLQLSDFSKNAARNILGGWWH
jgi:hypothetical protein